MGLYHLIFLFFVAIALAHPTEDVELAPRYFWKTDPARFFRMVKVMMAHDNNRLKNAFCLANGYSESQMPSDEETDKLQRQKSGTQEDIYKLDMYETKMLHFYIGQNRWNADEFICSETLSPIANDS